MQFMSSMGCLLLLAAWSHVDVSHLVSCIGCLLLLAACKCLSTLRLMFSSVCRKIVPVDNVPSSDLAVD